jgi:hypothetical protein
MLNTQIDLVFLITILLLTSLRQLVVERKCWSAALTGQLADRCGIRSMVVFSSIPE